MRDIVLTRKQKIGVGIALILLVAVVNIFYLSRRPELGKTVTSSEGSFSIKVPLAYAQSSLVDESGVPGIAVEERALRLNTVSKHMRIFSVSTPTNIGDYNAAYEVPDSELKLVGSTCADGVNDSCLLTYRIEEGDITFPAYFQVSGSDWDLVKLILGSFKPVVQ